MNKNNVVEFRRKTGKKPRVMLDTYVEHLIAGTYVSKYFLGDLELFQWYYKQLISCLNSEDPEWAIPDDKWKPIEEWLESENKLTDRLILSLDQNRQDE